MMVRLYGIKTCDTCRRARRWLDDAGFDYEWIDLRENGVDIDRLAAWRIAIGDSAMLNKRSKTWRDFSADTRAAAEADPVPALAEHPTLIKRPILETDEHTLAGFSAERYQTVLASPA